MGRPLYCLLCLLPPVLAGAARGQGVALRDLPELARARSERQRPAQEEALKPFWADLRLDYKDNKQYLDDQLPKIAALGDSVVPLLLEKLRPADDGAEARAQANNCARVLQRMEPASFLDALIDNLSGPSKTARSHSIWLLGSTRSPRASKALREVFSTLEPSAQRTAADALSALGDHLAAPVIIKLLESTESADREAALNFLARVGPPEAVGAAVQALAKETNNGLLPRYVRYFDACGQRSESIANALLPLLDGDRLDAQDSLELVRVLGSVAPEDHEPTLERLAKVLPGQTGKLGRTAALSMLALGDRKGVNALKDALDEELRKNSREARLYMQRGELLFALENWRGAATDFERAERLGGRRWKREALLRMASCEAHLDRWPRVLQHMRESGATAKELREAALADPAIGEALEKDLIRRWFNTLAEDG